MKKVKEKKELDYSRMPEHIWEKQLNEFLEFMKQLAVQVNNAAKMGDFIERTFLYEALKPQPKETTKMEIRPIDLEQMVHDALSKAAANGYADALADMSDEEVALEMIDLDPNFEHFTSVDLVPHVQSWRTKK